MEVLVIEKDLVAARQIKRMIKKWGHQAEIFADSKKALARIAENFFELVLLDMFLPDMSGYELIPKIKKLKPDLDIITMTNLNSRELELKARKYGIVFYLIKPFETKYLKSLVDHISRKKDRNVQFKRKAMDKK